MRSEAPLVSIVVVTYNHANYIEAAIQSVLEQTYPRLEVVVADDSSVDGSSEIVDRLAREHPSVIKVARGPNAGVSFNVNRGLRACTGEFVNLLDGDDLFLPNKIEHQIRWLTGGRDRVLCGHSVRQFGEGVSEVEIGNPGAHGSGPAHFLRFGSPFATISIMLRRSAIPSTGYDERLSAAPDFKFFVDCLSSSGGTFSGIPGVHARYRVHSTSMTAMRQKKMWSEVFATYAWTEAEHPEYAADCRRGRARLFFRRGVQHASKRRWAEARLDWKAATAIDPWVAWKAVPLRLLRTLPGPVRDAVVKLRLGDVR